MRVEVLADAEAVARRAAAIIAEEASRAVRARGVFLLATSGGATPWRMLALLAELPMPWSRVHLFQVDERVVAPTDPARNLAQLRMSLLSHVEIPGDHVHVMPVENANLDAAAAQYAVMLQRVAGSPPVLDLVHLGLGVDGHTASLVAGDPVMEVTDRDVAVTGVYQGHRRMTVTYPLLSRARRVLWVVEGAEKASALTRLRAGDWTIPAGRVPQERALVLADSAAAGVREGPRPK
ncbi:MAG: 6-phosphogluconolactonase [Gemmatimonadaceae bacterium]